MKIENLTIKKINEIMSLESQLFGLIAEDKEVILDRINTFREGCWGIFNKTELIGYCSSEIWESYNKIKLNQKASINHQLKGKILYITSIAILPEYQNKGFGGRLIKKLIKIARKHKLLSLYLRTSKARKFYEKNGFQFVKYVSEGIDNYDIMELRLS